MAKTLSFTDTSAQTVKIGDTTTSFTLICGNDNVATDLTNATSITVKLGNASGYLKSATVDPASLTDPTTGQITVNFNADLMTSLPAGSYSIEVWVVDSTGTSIYPSDGSTGFTITNNIQSTNGSTITTIAFDDFVKAMNKAASTIAKGDKGDPGPTPDLSNYTTVTDLNNGLSTKVTDNKNGTISVNGSSITPADDSKVVHNTVTQLNSTDMNTVITAGFYQLINGTNGIPGGDNWTIYQVIKLSDFNGFQLAYGTNKAILGIRSWNYTGGHLNFASWVQFADDSKVLHLSTGNTAARPTGISAGYQYFDTSLNKPIWYTGKNWVDATGTTV